MSAHPVQNTRLQKCLGVFAGATVLGFFFAAQMHYSGAALGRPVGWGQALYWTLGDWYEWAVLSPVLFWLARRFSFDRGRWRRSVGVHVVAGVLLSVVHLLLCGLAEQLQGRVEGHSVEFAASFRRLFTNRFHFNLAVYGMIVCGWHAWDYYCKYREREAQARELAGRLARAQLQALRMQLNPHFLFNTLNAVSSLMLSDVPAANRMISRLGELLRLSLDTSDAQEVPLSQEIGFLRRYLEIEQMRFGDRLAVRIEVEPAALSAAVPSLVLQPLVENAIRHAIEPNPGPGRIEISGARNNGHLVLTVSDNGKDGRPGKPGGPAAGGRGQEGIGLSNTRRRLVQLYGPDQSFELGVADSGGWRVRLTLPFRSACGSEASRSEAP